jgi:hypothetical protein
MGKKRGPGIKDYEFDNPGGRPTMYRAKMCEQIKALIVSSTPSDAKLAKFLGVSEGTLRLWKFRHEEFLRAYLEAWDHVRIKGVEAALYKRAQGMQVTERTFLPDKKGKMKLAKEVKKDLAPSEKAIEMITTNRDPKRWPKGSNKVELDTIPIEIKINTRADGDTEDQA